MKDLTILILLLFILSPANGHSGKLDDFEKKASKPSHSTKQSRQHSSDSSCRGIFYCLFEDFFIEVFFELGHLVSYELVSAGYASSMRHTGEVGESRLRPRMTGEALIPKFRFDSHYQMVDSDINAFDSRFEFGRGPIGIDLRHTRFHETGIDDSLSVTEFFFLYRMSFGNHVGMNFGLGNFKLTGNRQNTSFAFSLPIHWHEGYMGMEFRPVYTSINGSFVEDYDFRFMLNYKISSFQLGYRSIQVPGDALEGPYLGFSLHW